MIFISYNVFSQIHVKEGSFRQIDGFVMLDKNDHYDDNDRPMALIKISTENISAEQRAKLMFKGNLATYFDVHFKPGEIWLYLSTAATFLEIIHPDYGKTEYWLPFDLKGFGGYEMVLVSDYNNGNNDETLKITYNYLIITADQEYAAIYVNDEFVAEKECSLSLEVGKEHTWRIECPLYHTESGKFTMAAGQPVSLEIKLRPAFGYLNVNSMPEDGASVYINNKRVGVTPYKSDMLASGEYTVRVMKGSYKPIEKSFIVKDNETTEANINMSSDLITVNVETVADADIYIDDQLKGKGKWTGALTEGFHLFEAKKENHKTVSHSENIAQGSDITVVLDAPQAINGMIDVNCNPIKASIYIDDVYYGLTPMIVQDVIIGEHVLKLEKEGYQTKTRKIFVEENKMLSVRETLIVGTNKETKPEKVKETKPEKVKETKPEKVSKEPKTKLKKNTFVTLNYGYSSLVESSFGITFGQVKRIGWFVSAMSGLKFDAMNATLECDENFYVNNVLPIYSGETSASRISLTAGLMYRPIKSLAIKVGAGYGVSMMSLGLSGSDTQIRDSRCSEKGLDLGAGLHLSLGRFVLSADYMTTNFKNSEIKFGLGINIK